MLRFANAVKELFQYLSLIGTVIGASIAGARLRRGIRSFSMMAGVGRLIEN
jgi:hypothetical protein